MIKAMISARTALFFSTISILGSLRSSEAAFNCAQPTVNHYDSPDTIKKAYRHFLLQCHPDKRPTVPYQIAHNEFIDGQEAYDAVLSGKAYTKTSPSNTKERKSPTFTSNFERTISELLEKLKKQTHNDLKYQALLEVLQQLQNEILQELQKSNDRVERFLENLEELAKLAKQL